MATQTLPHKIIELNKHLAGQAIGLTGNAVRTVAESAGRVIDRSRNAGKTVVGQTRSATERTATTAARGAKEVAGQAEAQGAAVASTVNRESNRVVDRADSAVTGTPGAGTAYEDWTREQLYQRAQELHIDGRSSMSKAQLIKALRS